MFAANIGEEARPLGIEELAQFNFVFFVDACKLDGVQAQLLQVEQVEIPSQIRNKEVKCDTRWAKEAVIVGANAYFDTICKKRASRVSS